MQEKIRQVVFRPCVKKPCKLTHSWKSLVPFFSHCHVLQCRTAYHLVSFASWVKNRNYLFNLLLWILALYVTTSVLKKSTGMQNSDAFPAPSWNKPLFLSKSMSISCIFSKACKWYQVSLLAQTNLKCVKMQYKLQLFLKYLGDFVIYLRQHKRIESIVV